MKIKFLNWLISEFVDFFSWKSIFNTFRDYKKAVKDYKMLALVIVVLFLKFPKPTFFQKK